MGFSSRNKYRPIKPSDCLTLNGFFGGRGGLFLFFAFTAFLSSF